MARTYGEPIEVKLRLTNPKQSLIMGFEDLTARISDGNGKEVGQVQAALGGAIRVTVDKEDYDLSYTDLWNAVVNSIGKPDYAITNK